RLSASIRPAIVTVPPAVMVIMPACVMADTSMRPLVKPDFCNTIAPVVLMLMLEPVSPGGVDCSPRPSMSPPGARVRLPALMDGSGVDVEGAAGENGERGSAETEQAAAVDDEGLADAARSAAAGTGGILRRDVGGGASTERARRARCSPAGEQERGDECR